MFFNVDVILVISLYSHADQKFVVDESVNYKSEF